MARYTAAERKKYATLPGGRFPIGDATHATQALRMINTGGLSAAEKAKVRKKAHAVENRSGAITGIADAIHRHAKK